MEGLSGIVSSLATVTPGYGIFLSIMALIGFYVWYYMSKILKPRIDEQEKRETAEVKNQTHSLNLLQKTVDANERVTKHLMSTMNRLDLTLEKVSEKLSSVDERTSNDSKMLSDINNNMPSKDNVNKLHERINAITDNMADKNDVKRIMYAVNEVSNGVSKANEALVELRAKQS